MKIRTDFVTNSSSSSFIIARKGELNDKQKEKLIELIAREMLGDAVFTPEDTEEEIQDKLDDYYIDDEEQEAIRRALKNGKTVYIDDVIFENTDYDYAELFSQVWNTLEENGDGTFEIIDGDLSY